MTRGMPFLLGLDELFKLLVVLDFRSNRISSELDD